MARRLASIGTPTSRPVASAPPGQTADAPRDHRRTTSFLRGGGRVPAETTARPRADPRPTVRRGQAGLRRHVLRRAPGRPRAGSPVPRDPPAVGPPCENRPRHIRRGSRTGARSLVGTHRVADRRVSQRGSRSPTRRDSSGCRRSIARTARSLFFRGRFFLQTETSFGNGRPRPVGSHGTRPRVVRSTASPSGPRSTATAGPGPSPAARSLFSRPFRPLPPPRPRPWRRAAGARPARRRRRAYRPRSRP